jgi:hypothetical protein
MASTDENKALVRRFYEEIDKGNSAAEILIDPFLSDKPSWDKGWSSYLTGKNSIQGGER